MTRIRAKRYEELEGLRTVGLSKSRRIVLVVLVAFGLYFLIFHKAPLPGNHEAIGLGGLGDLHFLHDVIGIALLAAAGFLWYSARRRASAPLPHAS